MVAETSGFQKLPKTSGDPDFFLVRVPTIFCDADFFSSFFSDAFSCACFCNFCFIFVSPRPNFVNLGSCGEPFGLAEHSVCCTSAFLPRKSPFSLPDPLSQRFLVILPPFSIPKVIEDATENDPGSFWGPFREPSDAKNHPESLRGRFGSPKAAENHP